MFYLPEFPGGNLDKPIFTYLAFGKSRSRDLPAVDLLLCTHQK